MVYRLAASAVIFTGAIASAGCGGREVLYKGQPARYWVPRLKDRDPDTRIGAVVALGAIGPDGDVRVVAPALAEALVDSRNQGSSFQREVIGALKNMGPAAAASAVPAILEVLKDDPDYNVLREAIDCLGSFGPEAKAAEPALRKLLEDPNDDLRSCAEEALKKIARPGT